MAINEGEVLRQLERENVGITNSQSYRNIITDIGNELIKAFRSDIDKKTADGSGQLKASVALLPDKDGFTIEAEGYYKFVDEGVNAAPKSGNVAYTRPLVSGAPFSFRNLGVPELMEKSIAQWSGVAIGEAYGIAVSIKKHGIKAHNFTDSVITDDRLTKIAEDIATFLGLAVEAKFNKALK